MMTQEAKDQLGFFSGCGAFLGTQGWTLSSWVGPFYAPGTKNAAYLPHYATQFRTVELDTTFYAIPRLSTIDGWRDKTPPGFQFAAKFPKVITHEKLLVDSREGHPPSQCDGRAG